jgi:hypothetical protein
MAGRVDTTSLATSRATFSMGGGSGTALAAVVVASPLPVERVLKLGR